MFDKFFSSNELVIKIMLDKKRRKMIKLTWYEVKMGSEIGVLRCIESMRKKMRDAYGYNWHTWEDNIQGACDPKPAYCNPDHDSGYFNNAVEYDISIDADSSIFDYPFKCCIPLLILLSAVWSPAAA